MAPCALLRHLRQCGPGQKHGPGGRHGFGHCHSSEQMQNFGRHHMKHSHRRGHGKMHGHGHGHEKMHGHGHGKMRGHGKMHGHGYGKMHGHGHRHLKQGHGNGHFKQGHGHFQSGPDNSDKRGQMETGPHPTEQCSGEPQNGHNEHHRGPRGPRRLFGGPRHEHAMNHHGHGGPHHGRRCESRPIHAECSDCTGLVEPNADGQGTTESCGHPRQLGCCRREMRHTRLFQILEQYLKDRPCCQKTSAEKVQEPTTDTDQSNQTEDAPPTTEAIKE